MMLHRFLANKKTEVWKLSLIFLTICASFCNKLFSYKKYVSVSALLHEIAMLLALAFKHLSLKRRSRRRFLFLFCILNLKKLRKPFLWISFSSPLWEAVLAVMHSTKTNMVLGSRPTACHWWRQEGHPVLNARARTKVLSEAPSKPQRIGETEVKSSFPLLLRSMMRMHYTLSCNRVLSVM